MPLEIFVPNTGQGDCSFIKFPNGKNMLVDFNKTDVDVDIIEFLKAKIPIKHHEDIDKRCRRINFLVNTHPHDDHLKGIGELNNDDFYIDEIWESGHRLYVPASEKDKYKNYYDFLDLVKKLKERSAVKVRKAGRTPTNIGSTKVFTFAPSRTIVDSSSREDIHNQCMILRIEYKGNSILFAGDSDRGSWEDRIVPYYSDDKEQEGKKLDNLLESTVLHVSHHGSKYFFVKQGDDNDRYKRSLDKIKPSFTVVSVGKGNKHGHPSQIAINIYKEKTKYKRVWTTKDNKSMYFALKNDGDLEYKKDLSYEKLISIKHRSENQLAVLKHFSLREAVELELPELDSETKELESPAILGTTLKSA